MKDALRLTFEANATGDGIWWCMCATYWAMGLLSLGYERSMVKSWNYYRKRLRRSLYLITIQTLAG